MRKIKIAMLGIGTIGSNVLRILSENEDYLRDNLGICLEVRYAYVKNISKKRNLAIDGIILTDNISIIENDPEISICIECMGGSGSDVTLDLIKRLINKKKNIVMASKKCLALHSNEIINLVNKNGVELRFDATVGGAIPVDKIVLGQSGCDKVKKIWGIVNATTNYVFSKMQNENMDYDQALNMAKLEGYAENDSTEDIMGFDALYKMTILAKFAMNVDIPCDKIKPDININDIKSSKNLKQVFCVEKKDKKINYYVGLKEVNDDSLVSKVNGTNNIIFFEHLYGGERAYYGQGAGGLETASVMVEDIFDILVRKLSQSTKSIAIV